MPIRILCPCGADVTEEVSVYDKKTRSAYWFEDRAPYCRACAAGKPAAPCADDAERIARDRHRRVQRG